MYARLGLVLMVNHACNLRCTYCYTGPKFSRPMPLEIGLRSIDRALNSLDPGGALELGFFGGEPLIEAALISKLVEYATTECARRGFTASFQLTTNATLNDEAAWAAMTDPAIDISVSFDGLPEIHDRHRMGVDKSASADHVLSAMQRLKRAHKPFNAVTIVRPDNVNLLPAGLRFMRDLNIEMVDLSLDLWAPWASRDLKNLKWTIARSAEVWRDSLPFFGVNWFNEKTIELTGTPASSTARCSFGDGKIAVAPSGRLYPCERLIGQDLPGSPNPNPMGLPGHVLEGADFVMFAPTFKCSSRANCGLSCPCSNLVRTGRTDTPDELLLLLDRTSLRETRRVLRGLTYADTVLV